MRVVLDTNLFVSAIIESRGKPAQILDAWRAHRFDLILRDDLVQEIREVLGFPRIQKRHQWTQQDIETFLEILRGLAINTAGTLQLQVISEDPDDNMILACAVEGEADFIVSGDQHLLKLRAFRGIEIVAPAQFLAIIEDEAP